MYNRSTFKATIEVGECNGFMHSRWFANDQLVAEIIPTSTNDIDVEFLIRLPCTIRIELSGKNLSTDTKVDNFNVVIQDKFIKIKSMWLSKHPIPEQVYMNLCKVFNGTEHFSTAYFGFPGSVTIHFDESDPIIWHFKHNHYKVS